MQKIHIKPENKEVIAKAINQNMAILLIGETGTGKTATIRQLAEEEGKELTRINLTGQTGVDDIIGKYLVNERGTYWIDGLLVEAMKAGKWVVLDEINMALPEILSKLHSLLDDDRKIILNEKDGEIVKPAEGFRIFATMNPSEDYAGTKELNLAFLSRFGSVLHFDYADTEAEIVSEQGGIELENADMLVSIAREARQHKKDGKLSYMVSTRDLIYCSTLVNNGLSLDLAVETSIINKYPATERTAVGKLFSLMTDGKIQVKNAGGKEYKSINDLVKIVEDIEKKAKEKDEEIKKQAKEIKEEKDKSDDFTDKVLMAVAELGDTGEEKAVKDKLTEILAGLK